MNFCAIIGHADEPDMLERCIAHHLKIGVERIFVSLNLDDPASAAVTTRFGEGVIGRHVADFAADPFEFFTAAIAAAREWAQPDWVMLVDTDEFWLPRSADIHATANLEHSDLVTVERYNAPSIKTAGSLIAWPEVIDLSVPIFGAPEISVHAFETNPASNPPWITTKVMPKIMVRPELVERVERGAHAVVGKRAMRITAGHDLLVVHLPFTTRDRFVRKIEAIRQRLRLYGHRFPPGAAFHWKRWLEVDAEQLIDQEFDRQIVDASEVEVLMRGQILTTPAQLFERRLSSAR
jgi:hypothetical protein